MKLTKVSSEIIEEDCRLTFITVKPAKIFSRDPEGRLLLYNLSSLAGAGWSMKPLNDGRESWLPTGEVKKRSKSSWVFDPMNGKGLTEEDEILRFEQELCRLLKVGAFPFLVPRYLTEFGEVVILLTVGV